MASLIPSILFLFSVFFLTSCSKSNLEEEEEKQSIYEVLRLHGLPMGLLPKGINEFSLDDKGNFQVHLEQSCDAKFENVVHYETNVSGVLSYGQIQALSGISAQELFLWFPVKGIRVDIPSSGVIYFDVGVIYKRFSLSLFENPPDCKVVSGDSLLKDRDEGKAIAESVSKGLSGKFRYELDQEYLQRVDV